MSEKEQFVLVLTDARREKGEWRELLRTQIIHGLVRSGVAAPVVDYLDAPRSVAPMLADENCLFALCFDGFGAELVIARGGNGLSRDGTLRSLFAACQRKLVDFMHEVPIHERMSHQHSAIHDQRHLLVTSYSSAAIAQDLGLRNVFFVPSVTLNVSNERMLRGPVRPLAERSVQILLPPEVGAFASLG